MIEDDAIHQERKEEMTGKEWMGDDFSLTVLIWFKAQMHRCPPVGQHDSFILNSGEESELETVEMHLPRKTHLNAVTRRPRLESTPSSHYIHLLFFICFKVYLT